MANKRGRPRKGPPPTAEIGGTGLKRFGGFVQEEFLHELQGKKGMRVYDEMRKNDATVGAVLFAIEMAIRSVGWSVDQRKSTPEATEFLMGCMEDMSHSWDDFISEVLTMLPFGWAWDEITYKQRRGLLVDPPSKFDDGRIGWRKIALRGQNSLEEWVFDDAGGIQGLIQIVYPSGERRLIPITKSVLFRTKKEMNNPEGYALALDTPIPTPNGWKTMGAVAIGDKVFDETGKVCYVTDKSPILLSRSVYEIEFSTGEKILADSSHVWESFDFNSRNQKVKGPSSPVTTQQICETQRYGKRNLPNHAIAFCKPVDYVKQPEPISAYLLGYWLGDGTSANASFATGDEEIAEFFEEAGYPTKRATDRLWRVGNGFQTKLRALDLLNNKHIPDQYLHGSTEQRISLLQGLMDSDGTIDKDGRCVFFNSNVTLINQVTELIRSLGLRATLRCRKATGRVNNTFGNPIIWKKDLYHIAFSASFPIFRLSRKLERQKIGVNHSRLFHYIKSVRLVKEKVSVQCIQVSSDSKQFLIGKNFIPTHNSLLRNSYYSWYIKTNLQDVEAIGIERDLTGTLIVYLPEGASQNDLSKAKDIVESYRVDDQGGFIFPQLGPEEFQNWRVELISTPGNKQIDVGDTISRYAGDIMMSMLVQFLRLGMQRVGSYSLSRDHRQLFDIAILGHLKNIQDTINRFLVPKLFAFNKDVFPDQVNLPAVIHGRVGQRDVARLMTALRNLWEIGGLEFDEALKGFLRQELELPEPKEAVKPAEATEKKERRLRQPKNPVVEVEGVIF